ncbi:thioredoxin domain-containing protein [Mesorhizobium xinjiangense]|uniref:thioredoxin domain-containing protein n=1 Tax=Mesorhizobium xinjiangense TaxID=2678685 RepID=UPI0012ED6893|nr:thioredoxin domain-containing protein [Mesorhizobium xinjiangense]
MPLPQENLLNQTASPYLRQHADNPVHWRPWSADALAEAQELDRPILLSVGYSACHWCHVMAHQCFEDEAVAAVMNRLFVNIKVDREERPDIDQIYMASLAAMGEQGGWPLTMFLTPEARPFWGGTYFPKQAQYGRPGFIDVMNAIHAAWTDKRDAIEHNAQALRNHVAARLASSTTRIGLDTGMLARFAGSIASMIDPVHGGLSGSPKFPNVPFMNALWLNWLENGEEAHRDAFLNGLARMLDGGIYDHVGGGLCRYSTDAEWMVPHFEKMLYDNALLLRTACWAHSETGLAKYKRRIEQTVEWVLREMSIGNAFASSLDADSDGEEGKFYVWTRSEIESVLGADAEFFLHHYDLGTSEHWDGSPVLYRKGTAEPDAEDRVRLDGMVETLRASRETRVRPGRDDKILTDWNGLMIRALAEAGRLLQRRDWILAAERAFDAILASRSKDGLLPHSVLGETKQFPALSSDYAAMINAAISLFEATGKSSYRDEARDLDQILDTHYGDGAQGHYMTIEGSGDTIMRIRGDSDDAVPSATSQVIEAKTRLSSLMGEIGMHEAAIGAAEQALGRSAQHSYGQAGVIGAAALAADPHKLVVVGNDVDDFVSTMNRFPDPRRIDLVYRDADAARTNLPEGIDPGRHPAAAYYCRGQTCLPPVTDAAGLAQVLARRGG